MVESFYLLFSKLKRSKAILSFKILIFLELSFGTKVLISINFLVATSFHYRYKDPYRCQAESFHDIMEDKGHLEPGLESKKLRNYRCFCLLQPIDHKMLPSKRNHMKMSNSPKLSL